MAVIQRNLLPVRIGDEITMPTTKGTKSTKVFSFSFIVLFVPFVIFVVDYFVFDPKERL